LLYPPFDLNNDGRFNDDDKLGGGDDKDVVGSVDLGVGMPGEATLVGDRLVVGGSTGEIEDIRVNIGSKRLGRISWREIVRD
jgi:type IV pilus assembly protein PilY1